MGDRGVTPERQYNGESPWRALAVARPTPVAARVGRGIAAMARVSSQRPVVTILLSILLAVSAMLYTSRALTFVTSNLRLLPQGERYVVLLKEYQRDFGELNDIVIVAESPAPEQSKAYAARLVKALEEGGLPVSQITYRVDPAYFDGRGLLYLSVDELTRLRDRLFDYQEFIESYAGDPTVPRLLQALNQQIANAMALGFLDLGFERSGSTDLRFLESLIDQISARLDGASPYVSPWATAFSAGRVDDPDAGYFFSSDRHWLFMFVQQKREEGNFKDNRATIEAIRRTVAELRREFPDVRAGVTGGPAISNDEMVTAFDDSRLSSLLATLLTVALLVVAFRGVLRPFLMTAALAVSLAWSLGIITLVIGHLSIFSVMFISIVVGIGIDYGVYWLYRYQEELALGATQAEAVRETAERGGPPVLLGALTAMGAFLVLMLTEFQGIREFGFVSGIAILLAFVSMITLFPALLALVAPGRTGAPADRPTIESARWLERATGHHKTIIAVTLALTVFAVWGAANVGFDYNMLKLQAKGVESVAWEEQILSKAGRSGFAALATASSLDELRRKQDAFAALPSVSKVESVLMLWPDRQPEKVKLIAQIAPLVASVRVAAATTPLSPAELRAPLQTLGRRLRLAAEEGSDRARSEVEPVQAKLDALLDKLSRADARGAASRLLQLQLQEQIARDFADKLAGLQKNVSPRLVEPGDAPPELRHRYIGSSGRYLLRIHPAVDIWQHAGAERFVMDLRRVDPDVTGPPITSFEAIRFIGQGYFHGTLYALVLVTVVTAVLIRSVRGTTLALVPLALGVLWTLGFMQVFGLEFNLANVWALPLIIGTAAEFGVNMFARFQEGRERGGPTLAHSTVMAVFLNGLTTIAGFASLMVAHHRGIFGLGLLLTVGITASLFAALVVLPVLLRIFVRPAVPDATRAGVAGAADTG